MPSFRFSKGDQEIEDYLNKQDDKSEFIKKALYYYIYPEENKVVKSYQAKIQDLEAQIKILQQTILNLSNHSGSPPTKNLLDENSPFLENDEFISDDFQAKDDKDIDQPSVDELFTAKMSKLLSD